jgi:hypothetical protein
MVTRAEARAYKQSSQRTAAATNARGEAEVLRQIIQLRFLG